MQHLIFDSHPLKSSAQVFQSHQGHLRLDCVATVAGVLRYFDSAGNALEVLRHPDQILDPKSVATLSSLPITISHPIQDGQYCLVTPQNWKQFAVGVMGDSIELSNPYVKVNGCSIHDQEALELLKYGSKQLSPGYQGVIVPEKGVFDGKPYTHRQYPITDNGVILYNHVAIMDFNEKGRNGDNAVFLIDSAEIPVLIMDSEQYQEKSSHLIKTPWKNEKKTMKSVIFDAKDYKDPSKTIVNGVYQVDADGMVMVPASDYQAICDLNSMQYNLLMQSYNTLSSMGMESVGALADSYKEVKAALDVANKELENRPVVDSEKRYTLDELKTHSKLIADVAQYVDKTIDLYQLDSVAIKRELLKVYDPELVTDSMDEPAINGAYTVAIKAIATRSQNTQKQAKTITDSIETSKSTIVDMDSIQASLRATRRKKA